MSEPIVPCRMCDESDVGTVCRYHFDGALDDWRFMANIACGWAFDAGMREAEADAYAKHLMRIQRASFTCGTTGELHDLIDAIDTVLSGLSADSFVFEHNRVDDTTERKRNAELHGLLLQVVTWIGGVPFHPDTIAEVATAKRRIIEILESAIGSKEE